MHLKHTDITSINSNQASRMTSLTWYRLKPCLGRGYICTCHHGCSGQIDWSTYSNSLPRLPISSSGLQLTTSSS